MDLVGQCNLSIKQEQGFPDTGRECTVVKKIRPLFFHPVLLPAVTGLECNQPFSGDWLFPNTLGKQYLDNTGLNA